MMSRFLPAVLLCSVLLAPAAADPLGKVLDQENQDNGVSRKALPGVDDLTYLRRVTIDLIGRIPTAEEIAEYESLAPSTRQQKTVERLLADERFADRWTIFFADMLRLRSNAEGGGASIAFIHRAVRDGMGWDEMSRRMIAASGKAGATPELGYILGDNADPMALAGSTAQVFLGVRVACAQCHDHPFDVWKRKDFYGLAAYFGKTRRVQSQFTNTVYTTEAEQTTVLWPPEGVEDGAERKPMVPAFPFELDKADRPSRPIARLRALRQKQAQLAAAKTKSNQKGDAGLEALLAAAGTKADRRSSGKKTDDLGVANEAKRDAKKLKIAQARYRASKLRADLAAMITNPRNRLFAQSFVNRVWGELMGRGFVEPVDNFSQENRASHPRTMDFLADEFIAGGFELKGLVRTIVNSTPYRRQHAVGVEDPVRIELESAFLSTPMRRMMSEVLYDSVVTAGHLFDVKHEKGKNLKVVWSRSRVAKRPAEGSEAAVKPQLLADATSRKVMKKPRLKKGKGGSPYDVEQAIELDFDALLAESKQDGVKIERMQVMSKEEIEAMRMQQQAANNRPDVEYFDRFIRSVFDDNPRFSTSMRMASPAAPEHFLRIFGQPSRATLDEKRDHTPSMRQALMLLNGRLTHEASRVGELEPIHKLLTGDTPRLEAAIRLAYREILTRNPTATEIAEAQEVISGAGSPLNGMADLRWVILNSNEFRFLP